MADFVVDSFTDIDGTTLAAHTGETGATWAKHPGYTAGANTITSNRLRPTSTSIAMYYASGIPASPDYSVKGDLYVASNITGGMFRLAGRLSPSVITFYLLRYYQSVPGWQIYKVVNGIASQIGSSVTQTLTVGSTYSVELILNGTTISAKVDGTTIISVTDSAISDAGRAGAGTVEGSATTGYHIDNIIASEAGGGTTDTETLYDSATAAISLTDIAARVESLLSTLQSSDSLTDAVTSVETLLTSATGTGSVVDDLLSSLTEIISDSATVQVSASDVVTAVESLQSTAQSASAISEIVTSVESLLTTVQTLATVTDDLISGTVETILESASVSATATDVQTMVETVLVMVSTGSTLAELGAFIEGVLTTAAGTGSVVDVIIEYVDHLIMSEGFVFLPEQRGFVFLPEQRGFVFLPEQRGFVFDKRG